VAPHVDIGWRRLASAGNDGEAALTQVGARHRKAVASGTRRATSDHPPSRRSKT
jgi:hypothetical protein